MREKLTSKLDELDKHLAQLKKTIGKRIKIVRAIPLPPISIRKGPVPICPPDKQVKSFFNKLKQRFSINEVEVVIEKIKETTEKDLSQLTAYDVI